MRVESHLDPDVAALAPQRIAGPIVAPGSDVAVAREAPVVTGDGVMDTQLENMRRILCARVWSMYSVVLRVKALRLWAVKRKESDHAFPPSLIKRDDHPLVAVMVRQAQELAKIEAIDCSGDPELELKQSGMRLKALSDIQDNAIKAEKLGTESLRQAQDLIKAFHAMAQQYRMHRDRLDAASSESSDRDLERIIAQAKPKTPPKLESFLETT